MPDNRYKTREWVFVYGGSTATGSLSIQLAKLAGYRVVTTCSPRNEEFVQSLGADAVSDYNDPECGAQIRVLTENELKYTWDTVGVDFSVEICSQAISTVIGGAHYCTVPIKRLPKDDVKHSSVLMYTVFGEAFQKGEHIFPANDADFEFGKKRFVLVEKLVRQGKLKAHPVALQNGGLVWLGWRE